MFVWQQVLIVLRPESGFANNSTLLLLQIFLLPFLGVFITKLRSRSVPLDLAVCLSSCNDSKTAERTFVNGYWGCTAKCHSISILVEIVYQ